MQNIQNKPIYLRFYAISDDGNTNIQTPMTGDNNANNDNGLSADNYASSFVSGVSPQADGKDETFITPTDIGAVSSPNEYDNFYSNYLSTPQSNLPRESNADYFVNPNRSVNLGTYSGKVIGSVPIFGGGMAVRIPFAAYANKRNELEAQARLQMQRLAKPLDYTVPTTDARYQQKFANTFLNSVNSFIDRAQKAYGNKAFRMLENPSTQIGKEYKQTLENFKAVGDDIKSLVSTAAEVDKSEKSGAYLTPEAYKLKNEILGGIADLDKNGYSSVNIAEKQSKLKTHMNLSQILDKEWNNIKQDLQSTYNAGKVDGSIKGSYYDFLVQQQKEFLSSGRAEDIAKSLATQHPNTIFDEETGRQRSDQPFTTKEAKDYISSMFGDRIKLEGTVAYNQAKNKTNIYTGNPKDVSASGDFVISTYNNLANGDVFVVDSKNKIVPGKGGVMVYNDGVAKMIPFGDKRAIMEAIVNISSKQPSLWGAGTEYTVADVNAHMKSNWDNLYNKNTKNNTPDYKNLLPAVNKDITSKVNNVAYNYGIVPISPGLDLTGASVDNSGRLSFTAKVGNNEALNVGVPIPASSLSGEEKGILDNTYNAATAGNFVFVPGAKYKLDPDGNDYQVILSNGKVFQTGDHTFLIPKESIESPINGVYNNAVRSSVSKTSSSQGSQSTPNTAGKPKQIVTMVDPAVVWSKPTSSINISGVVLKSSDGTNYVTQDGSARYVKTATGSFKKVQ